MVFDNNTCKEKSFLLNFKTSLNGSFKVKHLSVVVFYCILALGAQAWRSQCTHSCNDARPLGILMEFPSQSFPNVDLEIMCWNTFEVVPLPQILSTFDGNCFFPTFPWLEIYCPQFLLSSRPRMKLVKTQPGLGDVYEAESKTFKILNEVSLLRLIWFFNSKYIFKVQIISIQQVF